VADEACPESGKLFANIAKVVDLAVIDNPVAGFSVLHRLMSEGGQIKDRETPVAQTNLNRIGHCVADYYRARVVRPAVGQRLSAPLEHTTRDLRIPRDNAKNSAHSVSRLTYVTMKHRL
jgi:hypothetical protein